MERRSWRASRSLLTPARNGTPYTDFISDDAAGYPIQGESRWRRIGSVPGSVEARRRRKRLPGRNGSVIRQIGNGDVAAALGVAAIPQLGDGLPIGEGELETPTIDGSRTGVGDGQACPEASGPLIGESVMHTAAGARDRRWGGSGALSRRGSRRGATCWRRRRGAAHAAAVASGYDAGLNSVIGRVRRIARRHHALVEGTGCTVAIVATNSENNSALLVHGIVARDIGARSTVHRGQAAGLRIASLDRPEVWPALYHRSDVARRDTLVSAFEPGVDSRIQTIFHVRHDPGAIAGAIAPYFDIAEVNGLHRAIAIVMVVGFGVAVIEAAPSVIVRAIEDRVLAFGIVAGRNARSVVVAVPGARSDVDAVSLVAIDHDRRRGCVREVVISTSSRAGEPTGRGLS